MAFVGAVMLVHPFPVAVVVATTLLLLVIVHHGVPTAAFLLRGGATILLSQVGVGALNEYIDREADGLAQPWKPIPAGLVRPHVALAMTVLALAGFVPLAASFGLLPLALIGTGTVAGLVYDLWLKRTPLSFLPYLVGFLCLLSWIIVISGHFTASFGLAYAGAALLVTAAHLAQSFPDIETDRKLGQYGLASSLGPRRTVGLILFLYAVVAAGGLGLALHTGSRAALLLTTLSLFPLLLAVPLAPRALQDTRSRLLMFRLIAPGLGLLAIGCLLSIAALG